MRSTLILLAFVLFLSAPLEGQVFEGELNNNDPGQGDTLGNGVSIDGDTMIAGAKGKDDVASNAGGAYIFERVAGTWVEVAKLSPLDIAEGDEFGVFVSIHNDVAVVGAFHDDDNGADSGSAYVFEKLAGVWTETAKLAASDASAGSEFGTSVAIHQGTIIIGAEGSGGQGAAYIFEQQAGVWQESQKLVAADAQAADDFGHAVMIHGDRVVIGAQDSDDDGTSSGSAYIFARVGSTWSQEQKLLASDAEIADRFGRTVSISGDRAVVGAEFDDDLGSNSGAVYLFERIGGIWMETRKFTASDGQAGDLFGRGISVSGDVIVIGGFENDELASNAGAAYVYRVCPQGWVESAKLLPPGGAAEDRFGRTAFVRGSKIAIGAPLSDTARGNSGSAYVFTLDPSFACPALFATACFGDGGDQNGCTDCPCGNNAPIGSSGGCLNSAGTQTVLIEMGTSSVSQANLRFEASGAPPNTSAVLTSGNALAPANMANPCFGLDSGIPALQLDGLRCAVQGVLRHGVRPSNASGEIGVTTNGWGTPNGFFNFGALIAGATKHFQLIYRDDLLAVCMRGQNTSQAVSVSFVP